MKRVYGAISDSFDIRDHLAVSPLPGNYDQSVDLRQWFPEVRDQGLEGACTMFAGSAILSYLYKRFKNQSLIFSPQFGYRSERIIEGDINSDNGAQSRTMMYVLRNIGLCLETTDPYIDTGWTQPTTQYQLQEAYKYRIGAYHRVPDLETLRSVLRSGYPASIAIKVYESFESQSTARTGIVNLPFPNESCLGGHEVVVVGDTPEASRLLVRNSWGRDWGIDGYFWLPYSYWSYVMDSWVAHLGPAWR